MASLCMGERARVVEIQGDSPTRRRLLEMGFTRGAVVHAVRKAPLGDPVEYHLRGYGLSLRRDLARLIRVAPLASSK
jgi:ferrous iron transport protein A